MKKYFYHREVRLLAARMGNISLADNHINSSRKLIILRLLKYMVGYRFITVVALFLTVFTNVLALLGPLISGYIIDLINVDTSVVSIDFDKIHYYCFIMVIFYIFSAVFQYLLRRVMVKLSQNVIFKLRKDAFGTMSKLKVSYFDKTQTGDIISRFSYDVETVGATICQDFITISTSFITAVFSLVMMLIISPTLSLILCITIPVSALVAMVISKKIRPLFREKLRSLGTLNGYIEEKINSHKSIRAYNQTDMVLEEFKICNQTTVKAHQKAEYASTTIAPITSFISNISLALICTMGSILYLFSKITLGSISSFILYSKKFSSVINELTRISSELQSALAAAERVFAFIDEEIEEDFSRRIEKNNTTNVLEFKDVRFSYAKGTEVLHGINFAAKKGETIAIVGKTGSGKTSIVNLIMGFYQADSGEILLHGQNIAEVNKQSLRENFSMILQEEYIFSGSFKENLLYGNENITDLEMQEAAKACFLHDYITSFKDGYDTLIGENNLSLSIGQKQLLMIARIMLSNKEFIILDEATSNVDTITEIKIQKSLYKMMANKTCFVIAHRFKTIQNADLILFLQDGNVIESGTHTGLLSRKTEYYKLYSKQFEN